MFELRQKYYPVPQAPSDVSSTAPLPTLEEAWAFFTRDDPEAPAFNPEWEWLNADMPAAEPYRKHDDPIPTRQKRPEPVADRPVEPENAHAAPDVAEEPTVLPPPDEDEDLDIDPATGRPYYHGSPIGRFRPEPE